jgi:hypothetical protein
MNKSRWAIATLVCALAHSAKPCFADTYAFVPTGSAVVLSGSGTDGSGVALSASASFQLGTYEVNQAPSGPPVYYLQITLTNTSTDPHGANGTDLLTGLGFTLPNGVTITGQPFASGTALTSSLAAAPALTNITNFTNLGPQTPPPLNVASGWGAVQAGLNGGNPLPGYSQTISASGASGSIDNFALGPAAQVNSDNTTLTQLGVQAGASGKDANALDGPGYGITPGSSIAYSFPSGNTGPQVVGTATFYLQLSGNINLSQLGTVEFQYGTQLNEPHFTSTPLPSSLVLLGTFFVPALGFYWFTNRKAASAAQVCR